MDNDDNLQMADYHPATLGPDNDDNLQIFVRQLSDEYFSKQKQDFSKDNYLQYLR
jgi:hypothetical protein